MPECSRNHDPPNAVDPHNSSAVNLSSTWETCVGQPASTARPSVAREPYRKEKFGCPIQVFFWLGWDSTNSLPVLHPIEEMEEQHAQNRVRDRAAQFMHPQPL